MMFTNPPLLSNGQQKSEDYDSGISSPSSASPPDNTLGRFPNRAHLLNT